LLFFPFILFCFVVILIFFPPIVWLKLGKGKCKGKVKGEGKGEGKAIPLQAWTGPESSRRFRLPDLKTIGI
jgi:hypothetical protein